MPLINGLLIHELHLGVFTSKSVELFHKSDRFEAHLVGPNINLQGG